MVARQPLRVNRILVGAFLEVLRPNHQLVDCLVPVHQRKAAAAIYLGLPPQPRQPLEGCLERGIVPLPEGVSSDRRRNRRRIQEGDYLDHNLLQTLNPLVPFLVRPLPSSLRQHRSSVRTPRPNSNRASRVYSHSRRGDLVGTGF